MREKNQIWLACFLGGLMCLLVAQAVFIFLWPAFVGAGLLHNFGMMMPSPTTQFSPSEVLFLRMLASGSALMILGPTLLLFPRHLWVSLFGLALPWALMSGFGMLSPTFPGGLLARLLNAGAFIGLGLIEWNVCAGICWLLRQLLPIKRIFEEADRGRI